MDITASSSGHLLGRGVIQCFLYMHYVDTTSDIIFISSSAREAGGSAPQVSPPVTHDNNGHLLYSISLFTNKECYR